MASSPVVNLTTKRDNAIAVSSTLVADPMRGTQRLPCSGILPHLVSLLALPCDKRWRSVTKRKLLVLAAFSFFTGVGGQRLSANTKALFLERATAKVQDILHTILEWDFFQLSDVVIPGLRAVAKQLPLTFENEEDFRKCVAKLCGLPMQALVTKTFSARTAFSYLVCDLGRFSPSF